MLNGSDALFARAVELMPGGVNSPVRAFRAVGGHPRFVERGRGARVWDAEGREYIDCIGSWGPLILGHAHPATVAAIKAQADSVPPSVRRHASRSRWRNEHTSAVKPCGTRWV